MEQTLTEHFVEHFDHHDPRLGADPDAVFSTMLANRPIAHSDQHGGFWVVSGYQDAKHIMQRPDIWTSEESVRVPAGIKTPPLPPIEIDPPRHAKYRGLISKAFSPRNIGALEPKIRSLCIDLIGRFQESGECELIKDFAAPLPTTIFTEMMGLPIEDADQFYRWKDLINHQAHTEDAISPAEATQQCKDYLAALLDERRAHPKDDIATALLEAQLDGEPIDRQELVDMTFLLFLGGLDTVTSAIGFAFYHLAQRPDLRKQLLEDPELIPSAVEELLRYEAVILVGRAVKEDVEIGGVTMKKGDRVLINSVTANRDPEQFENPDELDFTRSPNNHLSFAVGPHRCVGSHLARLEMKIALEEFHARIPDYRLRDPELVHRHLNQVSGLDSLPLVWS